MGIEVISSSSSELDFTKLEEMCESSEEMNRIGRTGKASSRAIDQTELPAYDQLSRAKLSPIPDEEMIDRIDRVAENNGIVPGLSGNNIDEIIERIAEARELLANPEIPLTDEANALFAPDEPEADRRNFLMQINQLVSEIMQLLSKLSDRDRGKTDHMKKEFDNFNNLASASIRSKGTWGFGGSLFALAIQVACGAAGAPGAIAQSIGGLGQSFVSIFASQSDATGAKYSNKISLITSELQNTASKGSDNSSWKQELIQTLNDVKQWMSASVRSN